MEMADRDRRASCPTEERRARFEAAWEAGELFAIVGSVRRPDHQPRRQRGRRRVHPRARSASIVDDPETAEALCPTDHPFGTKRPCLDTNYYATYNLPHVRLVDLRKQPITTITETGIDTDRRVVRVRRHRLRHRLRRDDRRDRRGRHHRPGRRDAEGQVGARPEHVPRADDRRVPEPVHDHRSGQPVGAVEHGGLDRAARRLDRRLPGAPARPRVRDDRADPDRRGRLGAARQRLRRHHALSRRPTPGTWAPTCPASRGCSCPTSAASTCTGPTCDEVVERGLPRLRADRPAGHAVQRRRHPAAAARRGDGARR